MTNYKKQDFDFFRERSDAIRKRTIAQSDIDRMNEISKRVEAEEKNIEGNQSCNAFKKIDVIEYSKLMDEIKNRKPSDNDLKELFNILSTSDRK